MFGVGNEVIKTFKHKGLEKFFKEGSKAGIQASHATRLRDILGTLDAANELRDMGAPGFDLHPWKGKGKGIWSVSVNGPWRVTFRFEHEEALEVDYQQPH